MKKFNVLQMSIHRAKQIEIWKSGGSSRSYIYRVPLASYCSRLCPFEVNVHSFHSFKTACNQTIASLRAKRNTIWNTRVLVAHIRVHLTLWCSRPSWLIRCTCRKVGCSPVENSCAQSETYFFHSGVRLQHNWGIFNLVLFKVIFGSFGVFKWAVSLKRLPGR